MRVHELSGRKTKKLYQADHHSQRGGAWKAAPRLAFLMGLALLLTACGGSSTSAVHNPGDGGGGMLFSAPPSTILQVRLGGDPAERIVSFRLDIDSIRLKQASDPNVVADLLAGANGVEFTHLAATFDPIAVSAVFPANYDQLELVASGAHVAYLGQDGTVHHKDLTGNWTSLLALTPVVAVGDTPSLLNIDVDVAQTVGLDVVNDVVTVNNPVITVKQENIAALQAPAPSGVQVSGGVKAANGGVERLVGRVVAASPDDFSLELGQTGAVLVMNIDSHTMLENVTPDTLTGMLVEVEGWTLTDGTLYAADVQAFSADTGAEVEGTVSAWGPEGPELVPQDGIGTGMNSDLVGGKVSLSLDGNAGYTVRYGADDLGGLPIVFDETHLAPGQRVEAESSQSLQADKSSTQLHPEQVELLRQTLTGLVVNYQPGEAGSAEFDLALSSDFYLGVVHAGHAVVHVYQRSTTVVDGDLGAVQDGQTVRIRGFLFCMDEYSSLPPGSTVHFALTASRITQ